MISCIIIDDEPLARKGLKEYVADVEFLELMGEYENPVKASATVNWAEVQLLFMDIQMPKITGTEFLKTLNPAPPVIFTTAFPEFALEGFELNALDYLVKPFSFERFLKAAFKAKEYYEVRQMYLDESVKPGSQDEFFFIKCDNKLVRILFKDILYIEALQNYVLVHTVEKKYITYLTFKSVEEYLPSDQFIKTHKSYIVSASKVNSIEANDIRIGSSHIPISRNMKEEVMGKLVSGKFLKR